MTDREAVWRAIQAWVVASSETDIELRASEVDAALDAMVRAECAQIVKTHAREWMAAAMDSAATALPIRACPPLT